MRKMKFVSVSVCMLLIATAICTITVSAVRPTKPELDGPTGAEPYTPTEFRATSNDNDGDNLFYQWNWGDGGVSDWIGPYAPGETASGWHAWEPRSNPYIVWVWAKDDPNNDGDPEDGTESERAWYSYVFVSVKPVLTATGPSEGRPNIPIVVEWIITDPDTERFERNIDWGDGNETGWEHFLDGDYIYRDTLYMTGHFYTEPNIYTIRVQIRERHQYGGEGYPGHEVEELLNIDILISPPEMPVVEGPTSGAAGTIYTFEATSTGVEGDVVQYLFDWGDGNDTYWIPEEGVPQGETVSANHAWLEPGDYTIRVKAREIEMELETDWTEFDFYVNRLKIVGISGGFGISASIKNVGTISKDVNWKIEAIGGQLPGLHMNTYSTGTIEPLKSGETATVNLPPFLGLGGFKITVTVECGGEPVVTETVNGFCLFFYVILL